MDPDERAAAIPIEVTENFARQPSDFDKPDSWMYYDHLIPGWVEEWEEWRKLEVGNSEQTLVENGEGVEE